MQFRTNVNVKRPTVQGTTQPALPSSRCVITFHVFHVSSDDPGRHFPATQKHVSRRRCGCGCGMLFPANSNFPRLCLLLLKKKISTDLPCRRSRLARERCRSDSSYDWLICPLLFCGLPDYRGDDISTHGACRSACNVISGNCEVAMWTSVADDRDLHGVVISCLAQAIGDARHPFVERNLSDGMYMRG